MDETLLAFFQSNEFEAMLLKVAQDDVASYINNNQWLVHHPNESIVFADLENTWSQMKDSYTNNFKHLVYGTLPDENLILETLKIIRERLAPITWNVNLDN
jgi:hypothetical protein